MKAEASNMMLLSQRVFDALVCYFPITFSPPPNDPFGITSEMLVSSLESCLCFSHQNHEDGRDSTHTHVLSAKRKLERAEELGLLSNQENEEGGDDSIDTDEHAMVRIAVSYMLEQLPVGVNADLPAAKTHALRALTYILRTSPIAHLSFGLVPTPSEGSNVLAGSVLGRKGGNAQLSVQDEKLMDMVDDCDGHYDNTDMTDIYTPDAPTQLPPSGARGSATEWDREPQAGQLLQSLTTLGEMVYALLVTEASAAADTMPSQDEGDAGTPELLVQGLTLIGELTKSITTKASTGEFLTR